MRDIYLFTLFIITLFICSASHALVASTVYPPGSKKLEQLEENLPEVIDDKHNNFNHALCERYRQGIYNSVVADIVADSLAISCFTDRSVAAQKMIVKAAESQNQL